MDRLLKFLIIMTTLFLPSLAWSGALGFLDFIDGNRTITGWAFTTTNPSISIQVHVYVDGALMADIPTDQPRYDVNRAYRISGTHGFQWSIPRRFNDNQVHRLSVYAIDPYSGVNPELKCSPMHFTNNLPKGTLDDVDNAQAALCGWAFDQDQTDKSIPVHIYMDGPAGLGGRFVGIAETSVLRPDVNAAYGITGTHGFVWYIPNEYCNAFHTFFAYAIDSYGMGINPLLRKAPQSFGTRPNGDQRLVGSMAGKEFTLLTSNWAAGAITSFVWNGLEFIDSTDHGRELQSAFSCYQGFVTAERFNPTEAGSDPDGHYSSTTSVLQVMSTPSPNILDSQVQMAFWNYGRDCLNTTELSNIVLKKHVEIGWDGMDNVIAETLTFDVPKPCEYPYFNAYTDGQFEVLTGYMPTKSHFTKRYIYNPDLGVLDSIDNTSTGAYSRPLVFATTDDQYAMGIINSDKFSSWPQGTTVAYGLPAYGKFDGGADGKPIPVYKWNCVFRYLGPMPVGQYTFHCYVVVGTTAQVEITLDRLYKQFN